MLGDLFTASCLVRDQHPVKVLTLKHTQLSHLSLPLLLRVCVWVRQKGEGGVYLISHIGKIPFRDWQMSFSVWLLPASNNVSRCVGFRSCTHSLQPTHSSTECLCACFCVQYMFVFSSVENGAETNPWCYSLITTSTAAKQRQLILYDCK